MNARHTKHRLDWTVAIDDRRTRTIPNEDFSVMLNDDEIPTESVIHMAEPATSNLVDRASGPLRGIDPHVALRSVVHQYFSVGPQAEPSTRRILPDGSIDLIFNLSEGCGTISGAVEPQACVIGILTAPMIVQRPAAAPLFGVSIAPGAASVFLTVPVHSLKNRVLDLSDLWGREANELLGSLRQSITTDARRQHMDTFLIRKLADARRPDPLVARAVLLIREQGGRSPTRALAGELSVSERHLERTFRAETGLSPKQFSRIARLQTVLARIGRPPTKRVSWAELACELGFADQAHLVREFRALTGVTPTEYARESGWSYVFHDGLAEL